jgi:hypothetical protein
MTDKLEIFINEQRADLTVFRIILTGFLIRLVAASPAHAEERLLELKNATMGTIGRIQPDPGDQGTERMKQLTAMRAEKFFLELEEAFAGARSRMGETGRN